VSLALFYAKSREFYIDRVYNDERMFKFKLNCLKFNSIWFRKVGLKFDLM